MNQKIEYSFKKGQFFRVKYLKSISYFSKMVSNLPAQEAKVYNLSRNEKSNEQISIEMGISKRTVENHLYSGLKKLKEAMSKYFESED